MFYWETSFKTYNFKMKTKLSRDIWLKTCKLKTFSTTSLCSDGASTSFLPCKHGFLTIICICGYFSRDHSRKRCTRETIGRPKNRAVHRALPNKIPGPKFQCDTKLCLIFFLYVRLRFLVTGARAQPKSNIEI